MIYLNVLPDDFTNQDIIDGNISLTDVLIKQGQLRMYKYFEEQLERNGGSITLEQYRKEVKPAVEFLKTELDKRVGDTRQQLIDIGLLKEE